MRGTVGWFVGVLLAAGLTGCGEEAAPSADRAEGPVTEGRVTPTPETRTPDARRTNEPEQGPKPRRAPTGPPAPSTTPPRVARGPILGADISWPQCPPGMGIPEKRSLGMPMPLDAAEFVIIGLTNGPGFFPNPCLPDQVEWVRSRGLMAGAYAVASFPDDATVTTYAGSGPFDGSSRLGALRNTGYQQARYNVTSMLRTGLETPVVWIDVEPVPDFEWSADLVANAAVVEGVARGYRDAGYRIGVYSTPYLWSEVVGDLALEVPEWRAAGQTSRAEALDRWGDEWVIQGGSGVLGQWVEADRDQNVTCPGTSSDMGRWFHQY